MEKNSDLKINNDKNNNNNSNNEQKSINNENLKIAKESQPKKEKENGIHIDKNKNTKIN